MPARDGTRKNKKNVLFLVPEQIRFDYLGCYGHSLPTSPRIDALARSGVRFDNCYSPVAKCAPSRIAVASGRYPHTGGYMGNNTRLRPEDPNLVRCFREQGYETMLFRKNHQMEDATLAQAYDHFFHGLAAKAEYALHGEADHPLYRALYRGRNDAELHETLDGNVARKVVGELHREREKPFFMWVSFWKTHPAFDCVEPFFSMFDRRDMPLPPKDADPAKPRALAWFREAWGLDTVSDDDWRELLATYFGMIRELDTNIGTILDALDASGHRDDTLVVLWGDHGEFAGEHQLAAKYDTGLYECLVHVPLIFSGPGIPAGGQSATFVEAVDVLTTLADCCGVDVPAAINGRSFRPTLSDPSVEHRASALAVAGVTDTDGYAPSAGDPASPYYPKNKTAVDHPEVQDAAAMLRTRDWKLVRRRLDRSELYDMRNDPRELHNRYDDEDLRDVRAVLLEQLADRLLQANIPPDRGIMKEPF